MKKVTSEESKALMLAMLSAIDSFCCSNNIVYSISCGTMLGAVRHGGFIPWDDDMDIYMLRKDYQRFTSIFPEVYEDKYALVSPEKSNKRNRPFAKVTDVRTTSGEKSSLPGVDIDVFPIDDVPDIDAEWEKYRHKQIRLYKSMFFKSDKPAKNMTLLASCKLYLMKLLLLPFSNKYLVKHLSDFAQINNNRGYKRVFECVQGMRCKSPFPKALFDDIIEWKFEDRIYHGFKDADQYLSLTYGDYMTLPPVEKRVCHHKEFYWMDCENT